MSQPNDGGRGNPNPKPPPSFTRPKPRKPLGTETSTQNGQPPAVRKAETVRSIPLEKPQVEIPKNETSNRTAQLNFRITPDFQRWFQSQIKFICAESGLRENQVSALTVQVLGESLDEVRYRALLMAGLIEPPPDDNETTDLDQS